jgi:hypothetical protein
MEFWCAVCQRVTHHDTTNRFGGDVGTCVLCGVVKEVKYLDKQSPEGD